MGKRSGAWLRSRRDLTDRVQHGDGLARRVERQLVTRSDKAERDDLLPVARGEHAFVMLLSREKFAEFSKLPIADPTTHALALYSFSVSSRDEVDAVGAQPPGEELES